MSPALPSRILCAAVIGLLQLTAACSTSVTIIPVDDRGFPVSKAEVRINGILQGTGVTQISISDEQIHQVTVSAEPSHFPATVSLDEDSLRSIKVALPADRAAVETIPSEESTIRANEYLTIAIAPSYEYGAEWWRLIINGVSSAQYQPVLMDERSGYLATEWREKRYPVSGHQQPTVVRRRIVGNIVSVQPLRYRVKVQVERKDLTHPEFSAWNRVYPEDSELLQQILTRAQVSGGVASGHAAATIYPVSYPVREVRPAAQPVLHETAPSSAPTGRYLEGNVPSFGGPVY